MKKIGLGLMLAGLLSLGSAGFASAECPMGGKDCTMGRGQCGANRGGGESGCPIAGKLMKKAGFLLKNADEIGLSDDQVEKIKTIKDMAKRDEIHGKADMEIFMMDLMEKLGEDKVDVEGINALLDTGSAKMLESGKK